MILLIGLLVVVGFVIRSMTPEDRERYLQTAIAIARHIKREITRPRHELEPFREALRARMPRVLATPALIAINVAVFGGMLFGAGSMNDGQTWLAWGGNYAPITTTGGWWRLFTASFVNPGPFQLVIAMLCLWQAGKTVERLVGRAALCGVYVAGGVFGGLISMSSRPLVASYGTQASMFAVYGALVASLLWTLRPESALTPPRLAIKRLAIGATIFFLFSLFNGGHTFGADVAALTIGLAAGAILGWGLQEGFAPAQRLTTTFGVAALGAVAFAVPMRGITDARPEIAHVVETEDKTVGIYQSAVEAFRRGKMSAEAMAQVIDRSIMPALEAAEGRLKALRRVPDEQRPLVADAEEYLRLRRESWRLRADGLRKTIAFAKGDPKHPVNDTNSRLRVEAQFRSNQVALGKAESAEKKSLEAFEKIKP